MRDGNRVIGRKWCQLMNKSFTRNSNYSCEIPGRWRLFYHRGTLKSSAKKGQTCVNHLFPRASAIITATNISSECAHRQLLSSGVKKVVSAFLDHSRSARVQQFPAISLDNGGGTGRHGRLQRSDRGQRLNDGRQRAAAEVWRILQKTDARWKSKARLKGVANVTSLPLPALWTQVTETYRCVHLCVDIWEQLQENR